MRELSGLVLPGTLAPFSPCKEEVGGEEGLAIKGTDGRRQTSPGYCGEPGTKKGKECS